MRPAWRGLPAVDWLGFWLRRRRVGCCKTGNRRLQPSGAGPSKLAEASFPPGTLRPAFQSSNQHEQSTTSLPPPGVESLASLPSCRRCAHTSPRSSCRLCSALWEEARATWSHLVSLFSAAAAFTVRCTISPLQADASHCDGFCCAAPLGPLVQPASSPHSPPFQGFDCRAMKALNFRTSPVHVRAVPFLRHVPGLEPLPPQERLRR